MNIDIHLKTYLICLPVLNSWFNIILHHIYISTIFPLTCFPSTNVTPLEECFQPLFHNLCCSSFIGLEVSFKYYLKKCYWTHLFICLTLSMSFILCSKLVSRVVSLTFRIPFLPMNPYAVRSNQVFRILFCPHSQTYMSRAELDWYFLTDGLLFDRLERCKFISFPHAFLLSYITYKAKWNRKGKVLAISCTLLFDRVISCGV